MKEKTVEGLEPPTFRSNFRLLLPTELCCSFVVLMGTQFLGLQATDAGEQVVSNQLDCKAAGYAF